MSLRTEGGAVASLVLREMFSTIGLRKSFAIFAAIHAVFLAAGYFMMEERRPTTQRPKAITWFDSTFFKDPVFWSLGMCFFFTVLYVLDSPADFRWSKQLYG